MIGEYFTNRKSCATQEAEYVRFRGPKGELPKGADGTYGTSLAMHKCLEDGHDIIVAWKQNGKLLTPDHGFPVRFFSLIFHDPIEVSRLS